MHDEKQTQARLKLQILAGEIRQASEKLLELSQCELSNDDFASLAGLNDRAAIYLQDIMMLLADERPIMIEAIVEFIELVEHFVTQVSRINMSVYK